MIKIQQVRDKYPQLNDDAFAAIVFQATIETIGEGIHLPSYIDGYMSVVVTMKNSYSDDPLRTIEALEGTMNESPFTND